jgi:predicted transcriptional regulator
MKVLWAHDLPMLIRQVRAELDGELAYTSVATVLGRLCEKGLVNRVESAQVISYSASVSEETWAARRIEDVLTDVSSPMSAVAHFVKGLSRREVRALRALLDEGEQ